MWKTCGNEQGSFQSRIMHAKDIKMDYNRQWKQNNEYNRCQDTPSMQHSKAYGGLLY